MTGRLFGLRCVALAVVAALAGIALLPLGASAIQSDYDYDCTDFDSRADAQTFYEENGGPLYDPFNLDDDEDGQACEEWDRKYQQYANGGKRQQRQGRHRQGLRRFSSPGRGTALFRG